MPSRPQRSITIAAFGETLWDILPRGIFLGGAPLNVAYHLSRQGVRALPISAVGRDFLGDEAIRRVTSWGIDTRFIARLSKRPTGTGRATLDARGLASYIFAPDVAWDRIPVPAKLLGDRAPAATIFGTLALREKSNRAALERLFSAWPCSLRVLDLNLRAPFDRAAAIATALGRAQFVKLNDDELAIVTGLRARSRARLEDTARRFARTHAVDHVCVTAGERGAGLLWDDHWHWEDGRSIPVRDTVGAGDAFLGALLAALLARNAGPRDALATACRMGEFVAARDGATPPYYCDARGRPRDTSG